MIDLVVVTDGRWEYLKRSAESWQGLGPFAKTIVVDDSGGNPMYRERLLELFPDAEIVSHDKKRGMAQSVRSGWERIESDFALHLEEDFVLIRDLPPLEEVCEVLAEHKGIANMGFERLPVWGVEFAAGQRMAIKSQSSWWAEQDRWSEHDHIYSLNPHVVPRRVFRWGWPDGNEAGQTDRFRNPDLGRFVEQFGRALSDEDREAFENGEVGPFRFAMWGHIGDEPYFEHIGEQRSPGWKL